ncbi:MAG TPA: signal peptidase II [Polyangiaceae bacterium]|nr:signal peptidase II [Polyangiaceae bacterium]
MTESSPPDGPSSLEPAAASVAAPEPAAALPSARPSSASLEGKRPSYVFFGGLAAVGLLADVASKAWAEITLSSRPPQDPSIVLVAKHLSLNLAYNKGGAWGLLQNESEVIRRPFFLCVSIAAVVFIVSLYSRLAPGQRALKWGLPLVLGGALGNLTDRVVRTSVVDFIDYRADWITRMNEGIQTVVSGWSVTDHWPTFNVADICICTGVALMAIDMIASKHPPAEPAPAPAPNAG